MPKISIIVPIYGVERYIERCVRSLFEQTLDDLEYIFVDDCTPDRSVEILESLVKEYQTSLDSQNKTVKIIRLQANGGLPNARKNGMTHATGEYIAHVDSDDWVEKNMYELMYGRAAKDNADLVVSEYFMSDGETDRITNPSSFENKDELIRNILTRKSSWAVWNKLVKRTLYQSDYIHPEHTMGEDFAMTMQCVCKAESISYVGTPLYHYFINWDSITYVDDKAKVLKKYRDVLANTEIVDDCFLRSGIYESYRKEFQVNRFYTKNSLSYTKTDREYYRIWRSTYPEQQYSVLFNSLIPLSERLRYILKWMKIR